jgi:hypothetical protein
MQEVPGLILGDGMLSQVGNGLLVNASVHHARGPWVDPGWQGF